MHLVGAIKVVGITVYVLSPTHRTTICAHVIGSAWGEAVFNHYTISITKVGIVLSGSPLKQAGVHLVGAIKVVGVTLYVLGPPF